MIDVLLVIHIVIAVLLIAVILLQKSGSDGLTGLGGGGGGLVTARAAANFFTKMTVVLAALFMINAIVLANLSGRKNPGISNTLDKELRTDSPNTLPPIDSMPNGTGDNLPVK